MGVSQMSASSPTWWLAWPVSIGPPRGWEMSPTRRPGQPSCWRASIAELLHHGDEVRMAPVAVAREAHGLPRGAVDGERRGAGKAALGVEADGPRRQRRGRLGGAEQLLGRRPGRLRRLLLGGRLLGRRNDEGLHHLVAGFLGVGMNCDRSARCQSERTEEAGQTHPSLRISAAFCSSPSTQSGSGEYMQGRRPGQRFFPRFLQDRPGLSRAGP